MDNFEEIQRLVDSRMKNSRALTAMINSDRLQTERIKKLEKQVEELQSIVLQLQPDVLKLKSKIIDDI